ncbi:MAG TPA: hypothetical protein VK801_14965 [Caulobacteraceae bacterium]|nr:hypothetical protein [Caulobacteraceae bacterium]
MKFLVFTSPSEEVLKNPPLARDYEEQVEFMRAAVASGRIARALHGQGRAIWLVNGESEPEVAAFFESVPLAFSMKREIEPLEDFFEHAKRVHAWLAENDGKRAAAPS